MQLASQSLLDCTFRDGGYQTNWDFPEAVVGNYLRAMELSGVPRVELGFRSRPSSDYRGLFYYSPETALESAAQIYTGAIGVMLDAKDYLAAPDPRAAIRRNFAGATSSPLSFVRVAANLDEIDSSLRILEELVTLGYEVHLNIMRVSEVTALELANFVSTEAFREMLFALGLADTFGRLTPDSFSHLCRVVAAESEIDVGIHAHNNRGLAVANALSCLSQGAAFVDCTMTGIGRGPGNAETESILACLQDSETNSENPGLQEVIRIAITDFEPMRDDGVWGYTPLYLEGSRHAVHPSYLQELASSSFTSERRWMLLQDLADFSGRANYAGLRSVPASTDRNLGPNGTDRVFAKSRTTSLPTSSLIMRCQGAPVILVGSGTSASTHEQAIEELRHRTSWTTLDASAQADLHGNFTWKVLPHASASLANEESQGRIANVAGYVLESLSTVEKLLGTGTAGPDAEIILYPRQVEPGDFFVGQDSCRLPSNINGPYAIALLVALQPSVAYLAGFDGTTDDETYWEMMACLDWARRHIDIRTLTPSRFRVPQLSIYSLLTNEESEL